MIASVRQFADLCGGRYSGADHGLHWREHRHAHACVPGEIYLALRGPRFDGNQFLRRRCSRGCRRRGGGSSGESMRRYR